MKQNKSTIEKILSPIQKFLHTETSGGIILIFFTVFALIWANSSYSKLYFDFWHQYITLDFGILKLKYSLHHWINDGLMVIFFLVVGLEIKRELLAGELSSLKKAALPIAGAIGGMIVPAFIYLIFNYGKEGMPGWGIPMATDIAFVVGLMALLGPKFPLPLKVFVLALAIVDDIGAVLVIAFFYTKDISFNALLIAAVILLLLIIANRMNIRSLLVYTILGIALWLAFLKSGVHATIAGVLLAFTIPARPAINREKFFEETNDLLDEFNKVENNKHVLTDAERLNIVFEIEKKCERVLTPLQRLENSLHPWVTFFIIPIFALANAGVEITGNYFSYLLEPVSLGIFLGLFLGKQIGIFLFSYLAIKLNLASPLENVNYVKFYGAGILCGIGFTMSLFIATLAFDSVELLNVSKIGILSASLISGLVGYLVTKIGLRN
ncbi:MAG: Na+/H+ antiporter NhaA [Ignavibacteria bacterium]|nr:Na+/H+ antiporter NhaA [Ignavibacteria bacterium]